MKKIIDEYPKEMRALVLHGVADLRLETVPVPELTSGCVLLQIQACGICSSDNARIFETGTYHFPTIPGHEFSGKIVAAADDVEDTLLGRRASVFPMLPCKECDACQMEQYAQCSNYNYFGSRCDGGFAEYLVVPVWNLVLYDDSVPYALAALSEPAAVSLHAVGIGDIKKDDKVAIVGTGTIGFLVAAFAKNLTDHVVVCGRSENKLDYAKKIGFETLNLTSERLEDEMRSKVGEGGFDVVIEAVGSNTTIAQSVDLAGNFGRIVLLGNPKGDLQGRANVLEMLTQDKFSMTLAEIVRPILFFMEDCKVSDIWQKMLEKKEHISVITDEYGCMRGIVTMEDVIETMLGVEIVDECDTTADLQALAREKYAPDAARYP